MGCFIGSAVIPVALLLLWKKANAIGAMAGAIIGMVAGIITWLVVAQVRTRSASVTRIAFASLFVFP